MFMPRISSLPVIKDAEYLFARSLQSATDADQQDLLKDDTTPNIAHLPQRSALPTPPAKRSGISDASMIGMGRDPRPLGQILIEMGAVRPEDLLKAVVMRNRKDALLGDILLAQGWVSETDLFRALSVQWRTTQLDPKAALPDPRLVDEFGVATCLTQGFLPWRRVGNILFIATARPESFAASIKDLQEKFGPIRMLIATERQIESALLAVRGDAMLHHAETNVPAEQSARSRHEGRVRLIAFAAMVLTIAGLAWDPVLILGGLTLFATAVLLANISLRIVAFTSYLRLSHKKRRIEAADKGEKPSPADLPEKLPVISVMVPMFHEAGIAPRLVARLQRLTYPRALTDILLIVEECDHVTREALAGASLPSWMRIITVPAGPIQTKPRALNYALNFCRGEIIGIWDAEDQPDPDQLQKVAQGFADAPPDVACLQGVLDFYNPRTNWLARCFTIEYASHFRAVLPGIAALGLVVPLGGTTVFFRRHLLEQVGAWDAWNVTEDADLGMRLARNGLRTQMLDTVTHEEANCRTVPWIKQRSRWLKGFFMTWAVHMRKPLQLWREIGTAPFLAFQVQMLGAVAGFLLTPFLWSCWLMVMGLPHPVAPTLAALGGWGTGILIALFVLSELLTLTIGLVATSAPERRHLMHWVPSCSIYYPLGCFAGWKAIYEVVRKPFYWDKTTHGLFDHGSHDETQALAENTKPGTITVPLRRLIARKIGSRGRDAVTRTSAAASRADAIRKATACAEDAARQRANTHGFQVHQSQSSVELIGQID